jgi:hypothetical protein
MKLLGSIVLVALFVFAGILKVKPEWIWGKPAPKVLYSTCDAYKRKLGALGAGLQTRGAHIRDTNGDLALAARGYQELSTWLAMQRLGLASTPPPPQGEAAHAQLVAGLESFANETRALAKSPADIALVERLTAAGERLEAAKTALAQACP